MNEKNNPQAGLTEINGAKIYFEMMGSDFPLCIYHHQTKLCRWLLCNL